MKTTQKVKWIDVREKLPKVGQAVICIQDPNATATREPLLGVFDGKKFGVPYLNSYRKFVSIPNQRWSDIIYWMPFPKTPKQLTDENTL